ncbi:HPr family phosphocarrier protein [Cucumibacter marinus]|uniref:HPr family phosphocarrier protein n=1 Tax=Cucumibacter marinus TaxID=1121252 RepID=UPI00041D22F1|nr:HPr family phosphocarrier protein [Cucumibacter marinus]
MPENNPQKELAQSLTIRNQRGLHARASARFVRTAECFDAQITVTRDGQTVGGTSIMGLMMLAAGPGSTVLVKSSGRQAREALEAIVNLIESGFGEDVEGETEPGLGDPI